MNERDFQAEHSPEVSNEEDSASSTSEGEQGRDTEVPSQTQTRPEKLLLSKKPASVLQEASPAADLGKHAILLWTYLFLITVGIHLLRKVLEAVPFWVNVQCTFYF